uniref:Large ribosomal subunit protein uL16m n=1 Tax=Strigamia maritima TaxID=126957 RepID=T1J6G4_STRMM
MNSLRLAHRSCSFLLYRSFPCWNNVQSASVNTCMYEIPPDFSDVEYPEKNKLPIMPKVPLNTSNRKPQPFPKRAIDMRGPELIHNRLIHKQFGVMALTGGELLFGHFEVIRNVINRKMDPKTMFAIWRVDPPWKPISRKSQGKRMGGGKSPIHHYSTPVKAGRIIFEMGGKTEFRLVKRLLVEVVSKLPFQAALVSQDILEKEMEYKKQRESRNINPFNFEYMIKNNMAGSDKWVSRYDRHWYGKFQ